jgi:hypothetical protein
MSKNAIITGLAVFVILALFPFWINLAGTDAATDPHALLDITRIAVRGVGDLVELLFQLGLRLAGIGLPRVEQSSR